MAPTQRESSPLVALDESRESLRLFDSTPALTLGAGGEVPLGWGKGAALLAFLAMKDGWHPRAGLAALLRPDADDATARSYLRGILHKLRQSLPQVESLQVEEHRVRWTGGSDVRLFELAMARSDWERAVALQPLPLLDRLGVSSASQLDAWIDGERLRLGGQLRHALMALILQRQAAGAGGLDLMQRLLASDPLDENALQFVLGQARSALERHFAVAAYQRFQRQLEAEVGEMPLPATVKLYDDLRVRVAQQPEPVADVPPGQSTRFDAHTEEVVNASHKEIPLGRVGDFQKLVHLIQRPSVRLITISGFGGVGKSVLARSLFGWVSREGGSPCIWVDLVAADSLETMLNTIALQAGLPEREKSVEDQLALWLAGRRIVLFLDNLEQLAPHAAVLSRLLKEAPAARIVTTSRETLRLPEEYAVPIMGLDHTGPRSAAARLFALHAERVGYQLDRSQDDHVAGLVEFLQGLPLAIELAATWLPILGPARMLQEIRGNPTFLDASGAGTAHGARTMQFILATAWQRLEPSEQRTLTGLAVFQDVIQLAQARHVAGADPAVLLRLVHKSVLQRIGAALFRLHPLLRDYVRANAPAAHVKQAQLLHCEYMLGALAALPPLKPGWDLPPEGQDMLAHAEDLVQAWRHAVDHGRADLMKPALTHLSILLHMGSRREEAVELCEYASGKVPFEPIGAGLAALQAMTYFTLGRMDEARQVAVRALQRGPQREALVWLSLCLSRLDWFNSEYASGLELAETALAAAGSDDYLRLIALQDLANCRYALRQFGQARANVEESLALARRQGARSWEGRAMCFLGVICSASGSPVQAIQYQTQALDHFQDPQAAYDRGYTLRCLSYSYCLAGDFAKATGAAEAALATFRSSGYYYEVGDSLIPVGIARQFTGQPGHALGTYREALMMCMRAQNISGAIRCIWLVALLMTPQRREEGFEFACFALAQKKLRPPDDVELRSRMKAYGFTDEELDLGTRAARSWTLDVMCSRVMSLH